MTRRGETFLASIVSGSVKVIPAEEIVSAIEETERRWNQRDAVGNLSLQKILRAWLSPTTPRPHLFSCPSNDSGDDNDCECFGAPTTHTEETKK